MKKIAALLCFNLFISTLASASSDLPTPELTAAQIVEKSVAARGGLEAWRKIETMVWIGHVENSQASASTLPFVLEQKRPNKTRFEIEAQNQLSLRLYDGSHGWKLRPGSNGAHELQPYSDLELSFAQDGQGIDGPLIDYKAKGILVALEKSEEVEGRDAYLLHVKLPSGANQHVWVDAQSFLEIKSDRESRNAFGQLGSVSIFYRDYRTVDGVKMPFVIESIRDTANTTNKMVIEKVSLNLPLADRLFSKPSAPGQRNGVLPDARRFVLNSSP